MAEAQLFGDASAADTFHVSTRTVKRYRSLVVEDTERDQGGHLAQLVSARKHALMREGLAEQVSVLGRRLARRIGELLPDATADQLPDLFDGLRMLGELSIESQAVEAEVEAQRARRTHPEGMGGRPGATTVAELN